MQGNDTDKNASEQRPPHNSIDHIMEQNLRTRLAAFPNDSHTWFVLGCQLRKAGKLIEAERALRRAVTLNPTPLMFWAELALVLNKLGHDVVDPEVLRRLGVEYPESVESEQLYEQLEKTKQIDSLRKSEAVPRITSHMTSPCVSCPDYTYYGCRRQDACEALIRWRTGSK
ncbi:MAG: tetratricopeptide repeat protein [Candidatus Thorarchaeota archaeon]